MPKLEIEKKDYIKLNPCILCWIHERGFSDGKKCEGEIRNCLQQKIWRKPLEEKYCKSCDSEFGIYTYSKCRRKRSECEVIWC